MSTTLKNGIIIPDNGSRNWGGDLANNWNILDVHVGYMNDVKIKITTLENSVAENTANIQINASNISALQTSKQDAIEDLETIRAGASAGATAVQPSELDTYATKTELNTKANNSDVVHKSGNEIISGVKTFSDDLFVSKSGQGDLATLEDSSINSTNEDADGKPLVGHTIALKIKGSQVNVIPCTLTGALFTSGNTAASLRVYKYKDISKRADIQVTYTYATDRAEAQFTNCHITPNVSGVYDIGSSTRKWKTLNGINPGALSLPNCGDGVDVTSQVVNNDGTFVYTNNLYDGWLVITAFADNVQVANQSFECRVVKSTDEVVTANIPLRLNELVSMRFTNFTKFAYVKLFKCWGNV